MTYYPQTVAALLDFNRVLVVIRRELELLVLAQTMDGAAIAERRNEVMTDQTIIAQNDS